MTLGTAPFVTAFNGAPVATCVGVCAVRIPFRHGERLGGDYGDGTAHPVSYYLETCYCRPCSAPAFNRPPGAPLYGCSWRYRHYRHWCGFLATTTAAYLTSLCNCTIASPRGLAPEHHRWQLCCHRLIREIVAEKVPVYLLALHIKGSTTKKLSWQL